MCTPEEMKHYRYLTIYRKDYDKKEDKGIIKAKSKQEYPDPIAESFKHYLEIEDPDVKLPMEDGDLYLEKVRTERPKIGKMYLSKSLDHNTIKKTKLYQGKTVYQVDYCDVEGDMVRKLKAIEDRKTRLPEDWVIPITTQRYDYRKPSGISSLAYERSPQERPPNNLDPNDKIREILHVTTGDSEYMARIGKLGEFITVNQMHGKITHYHEEF